MKLRRGHRYNIDKNSLSEFYICYDKIRLGNNSFKNCNKKPI